MLQIDNIVDYKDQFLQFGQNNEIGIHFTNIKYGVAKKMNAFLLEKFRCLLSNTQFDKSFKSFWAEVLELSLIHI